MPEKCRCSDCFLHVLLYLPCFSYQENTEPESISSPAMFKHVILRNEFLKLRVREGTSGPGAHENKQIPLFGLM